MPAPHSLIRGKIRYTSNKPERLGHERGREWFTITKHQDGRRSMEAHCEIDDAPPVLRQVCVSVGADWKPHDAFVRLNVGDKFMGSGWFRFDDRESICEAYTATEGRFSQRMPVSQVIDAFGCHPLAGDAWYLTFYDLSKGPGKQNGRNFMLSSPDHRGATGPMLFRVGMSVGFVGKETITVAAGTFEALHFQFLDTAGELPQEHPPYNIWVTADGDYLFLKGQVDGYMMTYYELVELERS